jgi:hypothetical protein
VFRRSQERPQQGAESLIALLGGGRIACVVPILRTNHLRVCAAISARENAEIAAFDDCIVGPAFDRAARLTVWGRTVTIPAVGTKRAEKTDRCEWQPMATRVGLING